MLRIDGFVRRVSAQNPWTNVYGLARTIVATSTALTLLFTSPSAMWAPFFIDGKGPLGCDGLRGAVGLFCIVPAKQLAIAHWIAFAALLVIASGWRPRFTGIVHWWISFSLLATATREGGDQVAALFALLLIPWTLTDDREWHWQRPTSIGPERQRRAFLAQVCRGLLRLQIMVVYLHSAVTKFDVPQWVHGTAIYFWVHDPTVGTSGVLAHLVFPPLRSRAIVAAITWGALAAEFTLVAGLLVPRRWWKPLFWLGVAFHVGIGLFLGIFSFSLTMIGALVVYLRPVDEEIGRRRSLARLDT
jgi:antimicrobial peptide system SdpB family protein